MKNKELITSLDKTPTLSVLYVCVKKNEEGEGMLRKIWDEFYYGFIKWPVWTFLNMAYTVVLLAFISFCCLKIVSWETMPTTLIDYVIALVVVIAYPFVYRDERNDYILFKKYSMEVREIERKYNNV